jgi:hypothetical protein
LPQLVASFFPVLIHEIIDPDKVPMLVSRVGFM